MFGRDICQEVCPWNRHATPRRNRGFHPRLLDMTKADWLDLTEEVFRDVFKDSAVKRTGLVGLTRTSPSSKRRVHKKPLLRLGGLIACAAVPRDHFTNHLFVDLAVRDLNQVNAWLGVHLKGHVLGALHHVELVVRAGVLSNQTFSRRPVPHSKRAIQVGTPPMDGLGNKDSWLGQARPHCHRAPTSVQHGDGESVLDASKPPQGVQAQVKQ